MIARLPENEIQRLEALRRYAILDTESESDFDDITLLASHICGTPVALVNLVAEHRQWSKSHFGIARVDTPREHAFCAHAILEKDVFVVENALEDARFSENPFVTGSPGIRFYAAAQLMTPDGLALGTLCVVDEKPRCLTDSQKVALQALSRQVVAQMELRKNVAELERAEKELRQSQLRHRLLFENILEGYAYNRLLYRDGEPYDFIYLAVNPAFEQITGLREVVGKPVSEVLPEIFRERPDFLERYARVVRTGIPERYEAYLDSLKKWFSVSVYSHEPEHFISVFDDITDRKGREDALRESDEKFHQLADHVSDGFWICSPDFEEVHYMSPAFERIWGRSGAELSGIAEFTHPEDRLRVEAAYAEVMRDRASIELEHRIVRPDGEVRWVRVQAFQVRDAAGQLIRQTGVVTDITETKLVADELTSERNLLRSLLENSFDNIYFKDRESRIIKSSSAHARHLDVSNARDMIGKTDFDFYTDEHAVMAFEEEQEIVRTGRPLVGRVEKETFRTGKRASWALTTKMPLRNDEGEIIGTFGISKDITELKEAEARLVNERARFQLIFDSIPVGVALCRHFPDGSNERIINDAHLEICGLTREQDLLPGIYGRITDAEDAALHAGLYREFEAGARDQISFEKRYNRLDGTKAWVVFFLQRHTYPDGIYDHLTTVIDITQRKTLEIQLLHSQKMETVGKLAGGVAHEFNSILTAIIGQSELLLGQLPGSSPMIKNATEIIQASGRAATLTRQLLAFSSKQLLRPETLDLNHVLASMHGVLQHLMGHNVEVRLLPAADLQPVRVDLGQIEQVIMNLTINAHDAMPKGGRFTLETANISFSPDGDAAPSEIPPGDYVLLTATDSGTGMTPEVKARAFEPFFTTKDVGQGTGLGLSTCYGIIKQSGGTIFLFSEPGAGTRVEIYLPQMAAAPKTTPSRIAAQLPTGTETILLVEENPSLRDMASTLLRKLGYTVHAAPGPLEILSLQRHLQGNPGALLITASTLPQMSGRELAGRLQVLSPHLRVLFTAAHATPPALTAEQGPGVGFLQKPFTPASLAARIRSVLDAAV